MGLLALYSLKNHYYIIDFATKCLHKPNLAFACTVNVIFDYYVCIPDHSGKILT